MHDVFLRCCDKHAKHNLNKHDKCLCQITAKPSNAFYFKLLNTQSLLCIYAITMLLKKFEEKNPQQNKTEIPGIKTTFNNASKQISATNKILGETRFNENHVIVI